MVRSGQPVQSLDGLALAVQILLGITAAICLFGVFAFAARASVLDDFLNSDEGLNFSSLSDLSDADDTVAAAVVFTFLGAIATGVVFIIWQFRHAKNSEAMGGKHGLGAEWAIAGWFIPCANYALPGVQLFQASKASDPTLPAQAPAERGQGTPLVIFWAIAFGVGTALFSISRAMFPDQDEVAFDIDRAQDGVTADNLGAASYLILVVAAVLGAVMVRQLTRRQAARAQALTAAGVLGYGGLGGYAPPPGYGAAAAGAWGQPGASGPGYGPSYGTPSGPGYGQQSPSGPGYGQQAPSGPGYGQQSPSGPGYGQQTPSGPGYGQQAPSNPGYGQQPSPPPQQPQPAPPPPQQPAPPPPPPEQGQEGWGTPPGQQGN
jgi:hypothetical protein